MLISRKPFCNNCKNRGTAWGPSDYNLYPCSCGAEIHKLHPNKIIVKESEPGMYFVGERQRCPDKRFFVPIYTKEQQLQYNHHK